MGQFNLPWYSPSLEAFQETANWATLILCGLFSGLIGSWEPLIFVGAAETVYLAIAPAIPFFRKRAASRVQGDEVLDKSRQVIAFETERAGWLKKLDPDSLLRAQILGKIRKEIMDINLSELSKGEAVLLEEDLQKIDLLYLSYLRLLFFKKECEEHLAMNSPEVVREELEKLSAEKPQSAGLQAAVDKNVEILKRRLEHLTEIQRLPQNLEMRLSQIENSFKLVADEVIEMKGKPDVSVHLNSLLSDVEATEQVARETSPILAQLQRQM